MVIDGPIDRARFQKVKILFQVVSALPPGSREGALADLCPEDPFVRTLVGRLLDHPDPQIVRRLDRAWLDHLLRFMDESAGSPRTVSVPGGDDDDR